MNQIEVHFNTNQSRDLRKQKVVISKITLRRKIWECRLHIKRYSVPLENYWTVFSSSWKFSERLQRWCKMLITIRAGLVYIEIGLAAFALTFFISVMVWNHLEFTVSGYYHTYAHHPSYIVPINRQLLSQKTVVGNTYSWISKFRTYPSGFVTNANQCMSYNDHYISHQLETIDVSFLEYADGS